MGHTTHKSLSGTPSSFKTGNTILGFRYPLKHSFYYFDIILTYFWNVSYPYGDSVLHNTIFKTIKKQIQKIMIPKIWPSDKTKQMLPWSFIFLSFTMSEVPTVQLLNISDYFYSVLDNLKLERMPGQSREICTPSNLICLADQINL